MHPFGGNGSYDAFKQVSTFVTCAQLLCQRHIYLLRHIHLTL
jgi:hypothetical protein